MDSISIVGEIVGASTALAGLILVYLGGLSASFSSYQPQERRTVKPSHQRRAWVAFFGFALALISGFLGLIGKWLPNECVADIAAIVLFLAFLFALATALLTLAEIK